MVTRILTLAAAAALMLASSASAQIANFRGGGHVSEFMDCPDWSGNLAVTARSQLLGDEVLSVNIFSPDLAIGWREFGEPDEDGWFAPQQTGMFSGSFTHGAEARILNIAPPDADANTDDFNVRFQVRGWPSSGEDCHATVRLQMRAQQ